MIKSVCTGVLKVWQQRLGTRSLRVGAWIFDHDLKCVFSPDDHFLFNVEFIVTVPRWYGRMQQKSDQAHLNYFNDVRDLNS